MPRFAFTARDRSGQAVESTLEASSRKDALRLLAARGLQPIAVEEAATAKKPSGKGSNGRSEATTQAQSSPQRPTKRGRGRRPTRESRLPFLQALYDLT